MPQRDKDHSGTVFHLMRHAPTAWNETGRIQGQADSPLTPTGEALALRWGVQLRPLQAVRIVTSDSGRTMATTRHINAALHLPVMVETRLREQDWGRWTGRIHSRLKEEDAGPYAHQLAKGWQFRPPGGESRIEVLERALAALADISVAHPGEHVLAVTHEGVIKCLVYHLAIRDGCGRNPTRPAPYHLHQVIGAKGQLMLKRVNALDLNP